MNKKEPSRQRLNQLKFPEKRKARQAIYRLVKNGTLPNPSELACFDCNAVAVHYDHAKGYEGENARYVEPVCQTCHAKRHKKARAIRPKTFMRDSIRQILEREVMTSSEAAQLLGIEESNLRHRAASGQLESVKKGQTLLFDRLDIELLQIISRKTNKKESQ
jgi:transcriptional regulator with GAF, ATPase, and Fis domain